MMQGATPDLFLSIPMIAVFALLAGAVSLIRTSRDRRRGFLMLAAAAVLLCNVLIWAL